MIKEFQAFIAKGNVLDLAVGVIIGAAFGKIVDSLVKDIITPLLSPLTKGVNFADYKLNAGSVTFGVGNFVNNLIQFLIIAFVIFLIVKAFNHARTRVGLAVAPAGPDHNAIVQEQNAKIIALLEQLNAR